MRPWWLLAAWLLGCGPGAPSEPSFQATFKEAYAPWPIGGWDVRVAADARATAAGADALALLTSQLAAIEAAVPGPALNHLRAVTLWVSAMDTPCPAACYHVSAEWLRTNGYEPAKTGGVEIANVQRFVEWSQTQPSMVLHELAHGYHQQVLGFGDDDVLRAFRAVTASGTLDRVAYVGGKTRRHYALTDEREFFAEMSESCLGQNDFFPFVRSELHEALPEVEGLMVEKWGLGR